MKNFLIVLVCALLLSANAKAELVEISGDDACKLYDALMLEKTVLGSDPHGFISFEKSTVTLDCIFSSNTLTDVPSVSCACFFVKDLLQEQMKEIYSIIDEDEVTIDEGYPKIYSKNVGDLVFKRKMYNSDHHDFINEYEFTFLEK